MKLKKIKLAGFKSFVDPTVLELNEAINGVVGPNGCGKSNVIDAVRWVLGESSASKLRGSCSEDVIFNGSTVRKPVGQAIVELVFDNSDGKITGEYAEYAEISVKRQLTREGQSNYYLNNTRCRRRDIASVFSGTGLSSASGGYAIIEQGMISRVIDAKPLEMRIFFEEAAGVGIYKARRKETETRMRQTRENLDRINDIILEQTKVLDRLKRQSLAAEKFKVLEIQKRDIEKGLGALKLADLTEIEKTEKQNLSALSLEQEAQKSHKTQINFKLEKLNVEKNEKNDHYEKIQSQLYQQAAEIAKIEQSLAHHAEKKSALQQNVAEVKKQQSRFCAEQETDKTQINSLQDILEKLEPQYHVAKQTATQASQAQQKLSEDLTKAHAQWDALQEAQQANQGLAEVAKSSIAQLEKQIQQAQARFSYLQKEQEGFALEEIQAKSGEMQSALEAQTRKEQDGAQKISEIETELQTLISAHEKEVEKLTQVQGEYQILKGEETALFSLQKATFSESETAIEDWLESQNLSKAPFLVNDLSIEPGWEFAVETVLGESIKARCVDSLEPFSTSFEEIAESDIAFIENLTHPLKTTSMVLKNQLLDKIDSKQMNLCSLLSGVFVAETLSSALARRASLTLSESIITKEGIWVGFNWIRIHKKQDPTTGVLLRKKKLEALSKVLNEKQKEIAQIQEKVKDFSEKITTQRHNRQEAIALHTKQAKILNDFQAKCTALKARKEQVLVRCDQIQQESSDLKNQQAQMGLEIETYRSQQATSLEKLSDLQDKRIALKAFREGLIEQNQAAIEKAKQTQQKVHQLEVQRESIKTQITGLQQAKNRLKTQLDALAERERQLTETLTALAMPEKSLKEAHETQLERRLAIESSFSLAKAAREQILEQTRVLEKQRFDLESEIESQRDEMEQMRLKLQTNQVRKETLLEQIPVLKTAFQAILEGLPEGAKVSDWSEKLVEVENKIKRLGPINMAAIEEYETEQARKVYLEKQHSDLNQAMETLTLAIEKIDKQTRLQFKETYDKINDNFQSLFPKLFGGGKAELTLVGQDLLEAGIAVMAQPPGKKNAHIGLLSGGEKALTAISLVFSIFQLNPAPFCILDEVDAPLDDANVGRFCKLVQEISKTVQFIVITHNKLTMEIAHFLSGVTMKEAGVSRLVSVNVEQAALMVD